MSDDFFSRPVLNSPYDNEEPQRHWELDEQGQPTQRLVEMRRRAEFITPIPKPRKQKGPVKQSQFVFADSVGISAEAPQYDPTPIINDLRSHVGAWRRLANPNDWHVTPEVAILERSPNELERARAAVARQVRLQTWSTSA